MKRSYRYFEHFLEYVKKRKQDEETLPPKLLVHNCINDEIVEYNDIDHNNVATGATILTQENMIKQIPSDILLDCMFYMDPKSLFCFIRTCQYVYGIFEEIYCESVPRLRLDILNKKRDVYSMNRLIDLFSNQNCGKMENVMMTYDQYFRVKSSSTWPSRYFHDHLKFKTLYRVGDPAIEDINRKANKNLESLLNQEESELKFSNQFPYGIFTQPDTYYITFEELVKRKCAVRKGMVEVEHNIERVVTPSPFQLSESAQDISIDEHLYMDGDTTSKYSEKIVRFFKHPYEMTLTDFQNRFQNEVLNETERILIYDCCFEHNRTTNTRERFVVSGGCLLHTLVGTSFNDIDIFVINNGESMEVVNQAIKKVLLKFEEKSTGQQYNIMSSKTSINIFYDSHGKSTERKVQIVLLKYDTIEELLLFFDLDCCKIAHDGTTIWTVLECLRSLKYKINIISNNRKETGEGEINRERALKYGARGFLTFVIGLFHPLYHAMHCDFIIEQLRQSIIETYSKIIIEKIPRPPNPAVVFFVDSSPGFLGKEVVDEDDTLAYPKIFRIANYSFVEKCLSNGYISALNDNFSFRNLSQNKTLEELESAMLEKIKSDGYAFVKYPSDLFKILPENHNFLKQKYSNSYLAKKYCIVTCSKCNCHYYSLALAIQDDVNTILSKKDEIDFAESNYDPRKHLLCTLCEKSLGADALMKLRAFAKRNSIMDPLEKLILLKLYEFELLGKDQVSVAELYKSFHVYPQETVKYALHCLHFRSNIEMDFGVVKISLTMRPVMDEKWQILIPRKEFSEQQGLIYSRIVNNPGISFFELTSQYDEEMVISELTELFDQGRAEYFGDSIDRYQAVSFNY